MLYLVPTPIGNMQDITLRALETLRDADLIACEDTRHSQPLLSHYGISKPLLSYHKFNEKEAAERIGAALEEGKNVAVISDAGTPGISDPGAAAVSLAIERGYEFTALPGANAAVPALVMSGFGGGGFHFSGFLPEKKKDRAKLLESVANLSCPLIFYVAPHDMPAAVKDLAAALGDRRAVAIREISKVYEERVEFRLSEGYPKQPRGEFVLVVEGREKGKEQKATWEPLEAVNRLIASGMPRAEAIKAVATISGTSKNELYRLVHSSDNE